METKILNTCRHCGKQYDRAELSRSLGNESNPVILRYCSAPCYTAAVLKPVKQFEARTAQWTANASEVYEVSTGRTVARCDIGGRDEQSDSIAEFIAAAPELLKERDELKERAQQYADKIVDLGREKAELKEALRNVLQTGYTNTEAGSKAIALLNRLNAI